MEKYLHIFLLFNVFALTPSAFGQEGAKIRPAGWVQYVDIYLYYRWQESERYDSVYYRALQKYITGAMGNDRAQRLRPYIKDKRLFGEYLDITKRSNDAAFRVGISAMLSKHQWKDKPGDHVDLLLSLADRAASKKDVVLALETLSAAFTETFWRIENYDRAFYIGLQLEEKLQQVSESDYPYMCEAYYKLGEAYYLFLGFHKSIELLENALVSDPQWFDDRVNLDALNILGICYANLGRIDTSDEYFRTILRSRDIVLDRLLYNAYALSHLGCNAMLKGQYDKAIAYSETVWPILRQKTEDFGHLAGMCYCRGRSHLEKGDFRQASIWIDSLVYFAGKDHYNQTKRIKQAYLLQADYYTAIGDAYRARIYNDSLVSVYKENQKIYTSQFIVRALQQYHDEKIIHGERELKSSRAYFLLIAVAILLLLILMAVVLSLYRKKNTAYITLARRAKEWAKEEEANANAAFPCTGNLKPADSRGVPSAIDREIVARIEEEMTENRVYREVGLTAEALAGLLGIHRNILSRAINRVTCGNFHQYINRYRIKEAVCIISETDRSQVYIDHLYERVGFASRTSFYRAFKQYTGLSPFEFQKKKDYINQDPFI